ncbi:MAG: hypothetical protein R6U46_00545 [Marinilabilia sp.]
MQGSFNYTLSRLKRAYYDIFDGQWFPDKFDHTYDLMISGTYLLNEKWDVGGQ